MFLFPVFLTVRYPVNRQSENLPASPARGTRAAGHRGASVAEQAAKQAEKIQRADTDQTAKAQQLSPSGKERGAVKVFRR